MSTPTIRREITRDTKGGPIRYVNSWCTACSYWHAFEFTLDAAYRQGERHLMNVHDVDATTASGPRRQHEHKTTDRENGSDHG